MKISDIEKKFKKIKDQIYCIIFAGSFFSNQTIDDYRDIDLIVVVKKNSLDLQRTVSQIALDFKKDPGIDLSVDIVQKDDVINPRDILNLHTKVANAIYEANLNPSKIIYFEVNHGIYKLTPEDIRIYSGVAVRELYQEAHKDISRNLDLMLKQEDPTIIKKYKKRIFNIIKMALIFKKYKIPQTKREILKEAERNFNYNFNKIFNYIEIIDISSNYNSFTYEALLLEIFGEIYSFYKYLQEKENIL